MCGIFACSPIDQDWMKRALQTHHPRGPDQAATFATQWDGIANIGLAVNRLAITGTDEKSAQPIFSKSTRSVCILNGAIYNFDDLVDRFQIEAGTGNDAAVIVELYEKIGLEFVNYLRGMYAFVLVDLALGKMVAARDTLGIKPLYWARGQDGQIVFSSSLKAIPSELGAFAEGFPPGVVWIRTPDDERQIPITPRLVPDMDLHAVLRSTVAAHIPKEVDWGCSLSGGVDSSLICALAKDMDLDAPCYSLFLGESADFQAARRVTDHLGLTLRPVPVSREDIVEAIPRMVHATGTFEVDMILGGLGAYFVAKAARDDGCKVLLAGMGADEIFGGYERYHRMPKEAMNDRLIIDQLTLSNKHCAHLDHGSMAASIEARVPYIDNEVVATARRLPLERKADASHKWRTKIALRQVAATYLPHEIYARDKIAMGRGSGMQGLFSQAMEAFPATGVSDEERSAIAFRNDVEMSLYAVWKRWFGEVSNTRTDLHRRSLVNYRP